MNWDARACRSIHCRVVHNQRELRIIMPYILVIYFIYIEKESLNINVIRVTCHTNASRPAIHTSTFPQNVMSSFSSNVSETESKMKYLIYCKINTWHGGQTPSAEVNVKLTALLYRVILGPPDWMIIVIVC